MLVVLPEDVSTNCNSAFSAFAVISPVTSMPVLVVSSLAELLW